MNGVLRGLLLMVLVVGVAGFGLCSLCGGVMGTSFLLEAKSSMRDAAWLAYGLSALGAFLCWLCWRGLRAMRRPAADDAATPPPA